MAAYLAPSKVSGKSYLAPDTPPSGTAPIIRRVRNLVRGYAMNLIKTGALTSTAPQAISVGGQYAPMTATLVSAAASRLIELSTDGGINYYTPPLDTTTGPMINLAILAPVSHVRFTGAIGDVYSVR